MTEGRRPAGRRRLAPVNAALAIVIVVLVAQMWLLTATLESFLAGRTDVALPALLLSGALFAVCGVVYRVITRLDREPPSSSRA